MKITDEMVDVAWKALDDALNCKLDGTEYCYGDHTPMKHALEQVFALSHAAGQEAVAWQCRLIAIATGEVVDDWRECSKESFDVDGGRPRDGAYLRTEYRALYIAPPTTSAEVGQDGEQCRVASGVEEIARQMDAMAGHIQASSPEQKSERLRGWASMLRALSRGVPEGDDSLPRPLWPVSKEWYRLCERRFAVDRITISGKLAEAIVDAVCGPAIAAQRKEG